MAREARLYTLLPLSRFWRNTCATPRIFTTNPNCQNNHRIFPPPELTAAVNQAEHITPKTAAASRPAEADFVRTAGVITQPRGGGRFQLLGLKHNAAAQEIGDLVRRAAGSLGLADIGFSGCLLLPARRPNLVHLLKRHSSHDQACCHRFSSALRRRLQSVRRRHPT